MTPRGLLDLHRNAVCESTEPLGSPSFTNCNSSTRRKALVSELLKPKTTKSVLAGENREGVSCCRREKNKCLTELFLEERKGKRCPLTAATTKKLEHQDISDNPSNSRKRHLAQERPIVASNLHNYDSCITLIETNLPDLFKTQARCSL